jgi:hypothetical protein
MGEMNYRIIDNGQWIIENFFVIIVHFPLSIRISDRKSSTSFNSTFPFGRKSGDALLSTPKEGLDFPPFPFGWLGGASCRPVP